MSGRCCWGARPEQVANSGAEYYGNDEANRYNSTETTNIIQKDLTVKALQLIGVHEGEFHLIADIGCGSGLSGRILSSQGLPWVGTDISIPMLNLAQMRPDCLGRLCLSDMSHGLPLRTASFDHAISISAVQWLCVDKHPELAAQKFFSAVWRCLCDGGRAAFQVYLENDDQAQLLLTAATSAGFLATYCMDYPHPSTAKKFYILLAKPIESFGPSPTSPLPLQKLCNLAWPSSACCSLAWLRWLNSQQPTQKHSINHSNGSIQSQSVHALGERLRNEHMNVGKRMLRLLRHSIKKGGSGPLPLFPPLPSRIERGGGAEVVVIEAAVEQRKLRPCGGPLNLQVHYVEKDVSIEHSKELAEEKVGEDKEYNKETDVSPRKKAKLSEEKESQQQGKGDRLPAGIREIILLELLGCSADEAKSEILLGKKVITATAEGSGSWTSVLKTEAVAAVEEQGPKNEENLKKEFFYLEHLESTQSPSAGSLAILHTTKPALPEILVLTSDHPIENTNKEAEESFQKMVSCPSIAEVRARIESMCEVHNACLVGLDAVYSSAWGVSCAWLIYCGPQLQRAERAAVVELWSQCISSS